MIIKRSHIVAFLVLTDCK